MIKKYASILIGIVIGILICGLSYIFFTDVANSIRILAVLVNGGILLLIAGYFNRGENSTTALKQFFLLDLTEIKVDYYKYLERLEDKELTKSDVIQLSKKFSVDFQQLKLILKREFDLETEVPTVLFNILNIVSGSFSQLSEDRLDYFDHLEEMDIVETTRQQDLFIAKEVKDLKLLLKNLAINITRA